MHMREKIKVMPRLICTAASLSYLLLDGADVITIFDTGIWYPINGSTLFIMPQARTVLRAVSIDICKNFAASLCCLQSEKYMKYESTNQIGRIQKSMAQGLLPLHMRLKLPAINVGLKMLLSRMYDSSENIISYYVFLHKRGEAWGYQWLENR